MTSLPMYRHQQGLPALPVPTVEETMRRYLAALKPIVSAEQYDAAENKANAFVGSADAAKLQEHLLRQQAATPNWLERLWTDSYLMDRASPGLHVSPVLGFDSAYVAKRLGNDGIAVGAHLCAAALQYHIDIEAGDVAPNVVRGKPLCMEDFNWCLGTCRVPCAGRDIVVKASPPRATHAHAVVMCRGRPFNLPLLGPGWTLSVEGAKAALTSIRRRANELPPLRVGALTYLHRDDWASVRAKVIATNAMNRHALQQIESALFVLSLDDGSPGDDNPDTIHTLMHGHSAQAAEARAWDHLNRWWDKGLHLHAAEDGRAGLTFEHSAQDSLPILTFAGALARRLGPDNKTPLDRPNATASPPVTATQIEFEEEQEVLSAAVERGAALLGDTLAKLNVATAVVPLSSKRFKASGLSPDLAVQASLQVAFRAARGFTPSTYESAATKTFLHGRTETLRPLTKEMAALVEGLSKADTAALASKPGPKPEALLPLFQAACKGHANAARLAASGQGCDRHLFGLLCSAQELGESVPDVLSDGAFKTFASITLSTTHPFWQPGTRLVGFGPVISPVCVGVGYFVTPVDAMLGVSTWRQPDESEDASRTVAATATRTLGLLAKVAESAPVKQRKDTASPKAKL